MTQAQSIAAEMVEELGRDDALEYLLDRLDACDPVDAPAWWSLVEAVVGDLTD